jgi:hypothetical protein
MADLEDPVLEAIEALAEEIRNWVPQRPMFPGFPAEIPVLRPGARSVMATHLEGRASDSFTFELWTNDGNLITFLPRLNGNAGLPFDRYLVEP